MSSFIDELNDAQKAPVLHKDGPLMVIAGAGSGKTRVLTYRIAHLMAQGVDSFNILALTFTNKAAREMKVRIANIVGSTEAKNLWMGTFHSVFAKLLRIDGNKLGYPANFTIYDTQDSQRLISSIIKEMGLDKDIYKYKQIQNRISSFKNSLITVKAYRNDPDLVEQDAMAKKPRTGDIYENYVDRCFKAGAMDFDDLLLRTNELLTRYPDVLMKYQDRFRYILVDEYQDTNHSQYLIVKALADRFQNICVVGDDAQSIYSFRGANISNILNFQKDYENVGMYRLEQNYRSTRNIVNAANSIIGKNKNQIEKVVWTANDDGAAIKIHRSPTDAEEGRFVANSIWEHRMQEQMNNGEFAVLYRTNSQSRSIEDALRKRDIPYRIYGGLSFYQRKEIKDVLSYLRMVINPKDEEALKRGIGKMENIEELLNGIKDFVEGQKEIDGATGNIGEFLEDVALATDLDKDTGDDDRVALMTIHLAKGLEFPYVYIVGMEEDLFPSGMSMSTRSELEEERRLFYVALTRAEKQAYLTYTQNRYRWGKLIDAEPSRFLEEIDEQYVENLTPVDGGYRYKSLINPDIFGDIDKSRLRQEKPVRGTPPIVGQPNSNQLKKLRKIKPQLSEPVGNTNAIDPNLAVGSLVNHTRFGRGKVVQLEGSGNDRKAEIMFDKGDIKKLLLRFAKLEVIS